MKILFLGAANSNHSMKWVNEFIQHGHEVCLVSQIDNFRQEVDEFLPSLRIEYLPKSGALSYLRNVSYLKKIIHEFKPDVMNVHYVGGYGLLARLSNFRPTVASCYGSDVYFDWKKKRLKRFLIKRNLGWADEVVSTSHAMAEQANRILGKNARIIAVTPFGVDLDKFSPKLSYGASEPFRVGIVKYLEPIYDIPLLLNAFILFSQRVPFPSELHIYGDGSMEQELREFASAAGVGPLVIFHGRIPNSDLPQELEKMDVFVNCSIQESFGVTVVEAMAVGLPVVATDTEGYKEIIDNGDNGIILPDRKPETMAQALLWLSENPEIRESLGCKARKKVVEVYDWKKNYLILESVLRKCVARFSF